MSYRFQKLWRTEEKSWPLLAGYCEGGFKSITLRCSGSKAPKHMNTLLRLATVELLKPHTEQPWKATTSRGFAGNGVLRIIAPDI